MNPSGSTSPWKAEAGGLTERNVKTSEKVKTFFWKTYHQGLPVGEQFAIKNIHLSPLCRRCNGTESITHLLFYCPYASQETSPLRWRDGRELESYNLCPQWVSKPALWQRRLYGISGLQEIIFYSKIATSPQKKPS
ncbi:Reverse transcriptase zinc-binding domain protein [Raphanus sativus]|nr:Reverse transcriptase zinc-binding domain protein [Raphanus sativus]